MAFGTLPKSTDTTPIPISSVYVPGVGFIALQGSTLTNTDGSSNVSTPAVMALGPANTASATLQTAQSGNAAGTLLPVLGYGSVLFTVTMAGFTGTVNFEATEDATNFDPVQVAQLGTNTIVTTVTGATTTSIHLYELASVGGIQNVRARTSGVTVGTVTVTAHALPLPVSPRVVNVNVTAPATTGSATRSNVAASASDVSLLAANTARKGAMFYNDSASAILYLGYGITTTSTSSYSVQVPAGGFFELPAEPVFTGAIRGIWSAAVGNLRVTELT